MRFSPLLSLAFAASACAPNEPDDTGASSADTGAGEDSGLDDTAAGNDTGSDTTSLTLSYDGDAGGLAIAFVGPYDGVNITSDVWVGFAAAGTSQTIDLSDPPDSAVGPVDMLSGARGAVYFLTLYDDTDGSGTRDSGEAWVSAGPLAIFMADTVPESLAAVGVTVGWNILAYPSSALHPLSGVPMNLHRPHHDITVAGTVEGLSGNGAAAMLLYPYVGMPPATPLYDEPLDGASWSITLSGPPPADHLYNSSDLALEQPLAYLDRTPSGFDGGDSGYSYACFRGSPVYLQWYATDDLSVALGQLYYGIGAGWTAAVASGGNLAPLDLSDYTSLVADGSCL